MSEPRRREGQSEGSPERPADREAGAKKAEQALAAAQAENRALSSKLEELDAELGEALVESARRAAAQRKAFDELTARAARLEKELAARTGGEARVVELEKEKEALANRLSAAERDRDRAMADVAALVEREAKLTREWEAKRLEWTERVGQAESLRAERQTLVGLMVAAERSRDRALAEVARLGQAHRAELDAQRQLIEQVKGEAAAMVQREARKAEAWQTARAELEAKIARLEADAVVAAGARTDPSIEKPGRSRGTA